MQSPRGAGWARLQLQTPSRQGENGTCFEFLPPQKKRKKNNAHKCSSSRIVPCPQRQIYTYQHASSRKLMHHCCSNSSPVFGEERASPTPHSDVGAFSMRSSMSFSSSLRQAGAGARHWRLRVRNLTPITITTRKANTCQEVVASGSGSIATCYLNSIGSSVSQSHTATLFPTIRRPIRFTSGQ